jgi:hypothetical protein
LISEINISDIFDFFLFSFICCQNNKKIKYENDQTHFGVYHDLMKNPYNQFGHENLSAKQWAEKQIKLLESIYEKVTGNKVEYRDSDLRQGGPYEQDPMNNSKTGSILVSENQLLRLKENKYLSIDSSPYRSAPYQNDQITFLASFYSPSVEHMNPELVNNLSPEITTQVEDSIAKNDNKKLMYTLLLNLFVSIHGSTFDSSGLSFYHSCTSLSPFDGSLLLNEQIIKFYIFLITPSTYHGRNFNLFYICSYNCMILISDSISQWYQYQLLMMKLKNSLFNHIGTQLSKSSANNIHAHPFIPFQSSIGWKQFIHESFQLLSGENSFNWFTHQFDENEQLLIKNKKYFQLFDSWFGTNYKNRN